MLRHREALKPGEHLEKKTDVYSGKAEDKRKLTQINQVCSDWNKSNHQ